MSHPVDIFVGQRIKLLRKLHQISQTDLGNELGLSFQQIQKYETGVNRISASRLFELASFFSVTPDYFFEGLQSGDASQKKPISDATSMAALPRL